MWGGVGLVVISLISFIIYYNFVRSGWSDWVDASECKNGVKTQTRICERAGDCSGESTQVVSCSSSSLDTEKCTCGEWRDVGECANGKRTQTRECSGVCNEILTRSADCIDPQWSTTWTDLGACEADGSGIKGAGKRTQKLECEQNCNGVSPKTRTVSCNIPYYGDWYDTSSCVNGSKMTARKCFLGTAVVDNAQCQGPNTATVECTGSGPIFGGWTSTETCTNCGTITETRKCYNGIQEVDSSLCSGSPTRTTACPCKNWGPWTGYYCDGSSPTTTLTRQCTGTGNGVCEGPSQMSTGCPTWTEWENSSNCSVDAVCTDRRQQTRKCIENGRPSTGCIGDYTQSVPCVPCWSGWSTPNCSKVSETPYEVEVTRSCEKGTCSGSTTKKVICEASAGCGSWTDTACDRITGKRTIQRECNGVLQEKTEDCDVDCDYVTDLSSYCPAVCGTGQRVYKIRTWAKNGGRKCPDGAISPSDPNTIRQDCDPIPTPCTNFIEIEPKCTEPGEIPYQYECPVGGICDDTKKPNRMKKCVIGTWDRAVPCVALASTGINSTKGVKTPICRCSDGSNNCDCPKFGGEPEKCTPPNIYGAGIPWVFGAKNYTEQCRSDGKRKFKQNCKPEDGDYPASLCGGIVGTIREGEEECPYNGTWNISCSTGVCDGNFGSTFPCSATCVGALNGGICVDPAGTGTRSFAGPCAYWDVNDYTKQGYCDIYGKIVGVANCVTTPGSRSTDCNRSNSVYMKLFDCIPTGIWDGISIPSKPGYTNPGHRDICKCMCTGYTGNPNPYNCTKCTYDATETCLPFIGDPFAAMWNTVKSERDSRNIYKVSKNWLCDPNNYNKRPINATRIDDATGINNIIGWQMMTGFKPFDQSYSVARYKEIDRNYGTY
jgi:hypothetical protein